MAYPNLVIDGNCPAGFETRVPSLFYETIYDTYKYRNVEGRFVFSNGDPTGTGYHGDFITGWDVGFLQQAVNTCTSASGEIGDCPLFNIQTLEASKQCKFQMPTELESEGCNERRPGICGNVPIGEGPGYAFRDNAVSQAANELSGGKGLQEMAPPPVQEYPPEPAPPTVTPPPAPAPAPAPACPGEVVTYTSAAVIYEVCILEIATTITTTVTAGSADLYRRHLHAHQRRAHDSI